MATLRLVPVSGKAIEVTRSPSTVGREPGCDIVVSDGSVSRRHAHLEERSGVWHVVDQGSANGTYVNSLRVAETALKQGQELRFGALAFRVDIVEDPEATVASPLLPRETDTVMAPSQPPVPTPVPPPPPAGEAPKAPRASAAPPPPPPAGGRARGAGASPVPPMPAGAAPAAGGKKPWFWVAVGCCGCILLAVALLAVTAGGAWFMTQGAADAAHAWLADVRAGGEDAARNGMTSDYRSRVDESDLQEIVAAVQSSEDATFLGRNVNMDGATLVGFLTGPGGRRPLQIRLAKQGGRWRVDDVRLDPSFGSE